MLSRILKLFGVRPSRKNIFYEIFCIPDYFWGWIPLTTIRGYRLIKKLDTDVIYASCGPFSSAVIGVLLKLFTGKPLVIDLRDVFGLETLMVRNHSPRFRIKINRVIEDIFFRSADILIATTEEMREEYIQQYPFIKDKMFTVHNGFDADYMITQRESKYQKFTIIYHGEFYFYFLKSQVFFKALALLKSGGKIDHSNFQFLFYGDGKDTIEGIACDYGIEDLVVANSRIPYKDVLLALTKSHLQLLRIANPMISTKFFEGIPLNVPFLATIPSGEVEGLIREYSPSSYIVTEDSAEKVADAILDAMSRYRSGQIQDNHIQKFLENFSRENLTLKLISIMEQNLKMADNGVSENKPGEREC